MNEININESLNLLYPVSFMSYAKEDFEEVFKTYKKLKDLNLNPWIDEHNLLPGVDWELTIKTVIKKSRFFIPFLSKNSVNKKGFVQKEIKIALDIADQFPEGSIYIIPARLDECIVPDRLSKWQWIDLFTKDGLNKLSKTMIVDLGKKYIVPSKKKYALKSFETKESKLLDNLLYELYRYSNKFYWCKTKDKGFIVTDGCYLELRNNFPYFYSDLLNNNIHVEELDYTNFERLLPNTSSYKDDNNKVKDLEIVKDTVIKLVAKNSSHYRYVWKRYWNFIMHKYYECNIYIKDNNHLSPIVIEVDNKFKALLMPLRWEK